MRERMIGRADLLNALRLADQQQGASSDHLAGMLGFRRTGAEFRQVRPDPDDSDSKPDEVRITARSAVTPKPTNERPPLSTSMWMLTELRRFDLHPPKDEEVPSSQSDDATQPRPLRDDEGDPRCPEPLPALPLVERHRLWPALRQSLSEERRHGVDLAALVRSLARAHLPPQLPQRRDRRWVNDVLVIWDTSVRLTPYQADFEMIVSEVGARHGGVGLRLWRLHGQPEAGFDCREVHSAGLVLVLSDLGNLAVDEGLRAGWRRVLHACRAQGARVVAWLPHGERLVDREAAELGAMHCLVSRSVRRGPVRHGAATAAIRGERQRLAGLRETLLVRAAVCLQLEVALLRRLRKTDAALQAEPGVEAMAWNHQPVVRTSLVSRALAPEHAAGYRKQFSLLSAEIQGEVLREVTEVHSREGRSTEMVETLIWQTYAQPEAVTRHKTTVLAARHWCRNLAARLELVAQRGETGLADRDFAADIAARTAHDVKFVEKQSEWFDSVWAVSGLHRVPDGMSDERAVRARQKVASDNAISVTNYRPVLTHGEIWLAKIPAAPFNQLRPVGPSWPMAKAIVTDSSRRIEQLSLGPALVRVVSRMPTQHRVTLRSELGKITWTNTSRPSWATEWGQDKFGLYADLEVASQLQRMRYIEPGTFLMGSPDSEPGRYSDEGPRHQVTLTEGYWLADTTCTQALWEVLMDKNPSHFKGNLDHPVEKVSWDDVQIFLKNLNELLPFDCKSVLPTEAQWEYACRAGTKTPYWFGDSISAKQVHFGQIWNDGRTVPVKARPANGWGLYQMHGNVWEWCAGSKRRYSADATENPPDSLSDDSFALRGGSWDGVARSARSAFRYGSHRGLHDPLIGFRFSVTHIKANDSRGTGAKRSVRHSREATQKSRVYRMSTPEFTGRTFPDPFPPECAIAWGDDRFGLWFDLEIGGVTQRMRWIEPGTFWMGSPETEPDRYAVEGPRHLVTLTEGYWLADTACTQAFWNAVVDITLSRFDDHAAPEEPVGSVSWDDIIYKFLPAVQRKVSDFTVALPTEAQWEYACRAGRGSAYWFGDNKITKRQANFFDRGVVPVKALPANGWGLYQMHGNVWEWCEGSLRSYEELSTENPPDGQDPNSRALRGGSWFNEARLARSACRREARRKTRNRNFGFRFSLRPTNPSHGTQADRSR